MRIIEAWGTGIPRIINRCKEYGLREPVVDEFGDSFKVTMYRKVSNDMKKVSNAFATYMPMLSEANTSKVYIENIENVFNRCGTDGIFSQANVIEWLHCSKSKATNVMKAMKEAKIIDKVKGLGPGKYQFIQL